MMYIWMLSYNNNVTSYNAMLHVTRMNEWCSSMRSSRRASQIFGFLWSQRETRKDIVVVLFLIEFDTGSSKPDSWPIHALHLWHWFLRSDKQQHSWTSSVSTVIYWNLIHENQYTSDLGAQRAKTLRPGCPCTECCENREIGTNLTRTKIPTFLLDVIMEPSFIVRSISFVRSFWKEPASYTATF